MRNGRCRLHGGKSTGPRTPEGLERSRKANWKHGYHSRAAIAQRREARATMRMMRALLAGAKDMSIERFEETFGALLCVSGKRRACIRSHLRTGRFWAAHLGNRLRTH